MKLAFAGADSVGKTQLIQAVSERLVGAGGKVRTLSIGDMARESPFPLITSQTAASSQWIMERLMREETAASGGLVLCDRCALDVLVFGRLAQLREPGDARQWATVEELAVNWLASYEAVFVALIGPNFPPRLDQIPGGDLDLRAEFNAILKDLASILVDAPIVLLPDALDERLLVVDRVIRGDPHGHLRSPAGD